MGKSGKGGGGDGWKEPERSEGGRDNQVGHDHRERESKDLSGESQRLLQVSEGTLVQNWLGKRPGNHDLPLASLSYGFSRMNPGGRGFVFPLSSFPFSRSKREYPTEVVVEWRFLF